MAIIRAYFEDKTFENVDFTLETLPQGEYENCCFVNCNFSNSNLMNIVFAETNFDGCNLSMAKLNNTALRDVKFKDCKLLGLYFEHCNPFLFAVGFENCSLNLSSFYKMKMKKTRFKNCSLHEVDFTEADLSQAVFDNCDLQRATFKQTILLKADFRTSYNYSLDPEANRIKGARFSIAGISGLLDKYDIEIS
ncbi:MAG: pentapeptide repeat-containing protein [Bacteroidota bacterium]